MQNSGLDESEAGIMIAGRNINNLRYANDTTLMAESEEELKSLLMKVKVESEKVGLKLNIQKMNIMASGPITSWQIDGETMETVRDFIFLGSKITADGDCSHEIKRHLLLGRKAITNADSILKSRHHSADKDPHSQSYGFSVVMYRCEKVKDAQLCLTLCDPMDYTVHGILQARILEWVGSHSLLQGIFTTQGSNPGLLHCKRILYQLNHQGSPRFLY